MKLSVSLADEDVQFLDEYARSHGYASRSAVLQKAVRLLSTAGLEQDYADAWQEWHQSGEDSIWEQTVSDGLEDR